MSDVDERLLCHCSIPCANRATQEDGMCDTCRHREDTEGCLHQGAVGSDMTVTRSVPIGRVKAGSLKLGMPFRYTVQLK